MVALTARFESNAVCVGPFSSTAALLAALEQAYDAGLTVISIIVANEPTKHVQVYAPSEARTLGALGAHEKAGILLERPLC